MNVLMPSRRFFLPLMTAVVAASPVLAVPASRSVDASSTAQSATSSSAPQPSGALVLKLRRNASTVDLLVEGAGASPVLQQGGSAGVWIGQLRTATPTGLRLGPQRISLPEAGLQSVSLTGAGSTYQLQVVPMPGMPLARPVVSADGANLVISFAAPAGGSTSSSARLDLREPGTVPQQTFAPPLQARAVAPPLGDMAVGSMTVAPIGYLKLSGPLVTLTARKALARDVLMQLARLGNYSFSYQEAIAEKSVETKQSSGQNETKEKSVQALGPAQSPYVTASFQRENYARAFNTILLSTGLQGRLEGNTIIVGTAALNATFKPRLSKVYRLNQASASGAADYLASLGASITKVSVITNSVTQGNTQANAIQGGPSSQQTQSQKITTTETYGGGVGPLKGLIGTTDSRLQTITLIGDPQLVVVAENYLRQIDLRQRQVALSVKILDVTLDNDAAISNSFAFRYGNNFIVSDRGQLVGAFGSYLPPNNNTFDTIAGGAQSGKPERLTATGTDAQVASQVLPPLAPSPINPGSVYPANNFYDLVKAVITSASTKTLASPTLFLSDNPEANASSSSSSSTSSSSGSGGAFVTTVTDPGSPIGRNNANEAFVVVGAQEITSYTVNQGSNGAPNTCQPVFQTAGLTLGARVKRIDDNGFVTFNLSPAITALTGTSVTVEGCGSVKTIAVRALDTGDVRVRDGQTLILTGVISDQDIQAVRKWPILGDIPFVGQFFRDSSNGRKKRELVIMVTPRIVNDVDGGTYGYGYRPETQDARRLMGQGV